MRTFNKILAGLIYFSVISAIAYFPFLFFLFVVLFVIYESKMQIFSSRESREFTRHLSNYRDSLNEKLPYDQPMSTEEKQAYTNSSKRKQKRG
jgi:hypothetical protein